MTAVLSTAALVGCNCGPSPTVKPMCSASAGIASSSEAHEPALLEALSSGGWVLAPGVGADDPECRSLEPEAPRAFSLRLPGDLDCNDVSVNGESVLGFRAVTQSAQFYLGFAAADGTVRKVAIDATARWFTAGERGFLLVHQPAQSCYLTRQLGSAGETIRDVGEEVGAHVTINPLGGYVARVDEPVDGGTAIELKWLSQDLAPASEDQRALVHSWPRTQSNEIVAVDRNGLALVLARFYPPSISSPAPPSTWDFAARWVAADGSSKPVFAPVIPKIIPRSAYDDGAPPPDDWYFGRWGPMIPLAEGGLAAYQHPATTAEEDVSPGPGWHTWYPSGESRAESAPGWMAQYDHTLQALANGQGYVALRRDPVTCERSVLLVAPSGRLCRTLALQAPDTCDAKETLWPDGSLVLKSKSAPCHLRWWPRLAQP